MLSMMKLKALMYLIDQILTIITIAVAQFLIHLRYYILN
jgi:hypothetical protein